MKRLNKFISDTGYCSRREADTYIEQGRVTVNGREASLGDMIGDTDLVEVDGDKIGRRKKPPVYMAFNKPEGVTCTTDQSDRSNIIDFIGYKERIFPVGRLDKDSEGLILLTNDGDIVNKILRAGNNNPKEYVVTVDKPITTDFLNRMGNGVNILGITTKPCKVFKVKDTVFVIHLTQGLNRQIRRMCQALEFKVMKLKRVKVLNITLGNLEPGRWRHLTPEEVREMHELLEKSSGTEEASNEKKTFRTRSHAHKKQGSYAQYRQRGKTDKSEAGEYEMTKFAAGKPAKKSYASNKSTSKVPANMSRSDVKLDVKTSKSPAKPATKGNKDSKTRRQHPSRKDRF